MLSGRTPPVGGDSLLHDLHRRVRNRCAPGDTNMSDKSGSGSEHHESRRERVATDDSLREERGRADTELAKNRTTANQIADDVVRLARARADALVDGARIATDRATDARSGAH